MLRFPVTFDTVTEDSAEIGDVAERGYISRGSTLREAVEAFCDVRAANGYVEANELPVEAPRWLTAYGDMEDGASETRSLHFPDSITPASRRRLARLLGCYGVGPNQGFNPLR